VILCEKHAYCTQNLTTSEDIVVALNMQVFTTLECDNEPIHKTSK